MSHRSLLRLIGEIDAICLESEPVCEGLENVAVYIEVAGERYKLMYELRTGNGVISRAISRHGLAKVLKSRL